MECECFNSAKEYRPVNWKQCEQNEKKNERKIIRILLMPLLLACYLIIFPQNIWIWLVRLIAFNNNDRLSLLLSITYLAITRSLFFIGTRSICDICSQCLVSFRFKFPTCPTSTGRGLLLLVCSSLRFGNMFIMQLV